MQFEVVFRNVDKFFLFKEGMCNGVDFFFSYMENSYQLLVIIYIIYMYNIYNMFIY